MSAPRPAPLASRPEKRKHARRDVIGSQLLSVDVDAQHASALILDASEGGMSLQLATPLKSRSKGTFAFLPPDQPMRVKLTGVPAWTAGDRAGISFSEVDQRSRSSLKQWLSSLPPVQTSDPVAVPAEPLAAHQDHSQDHSLTASKAQQSVPNEPVSPPAPSPAPSQANLDSIASRARILLCGTGAAVAWGSPEGMICRSSDGNAPPKGVPVDINRGLSGECVRTGAVVRCDDTESDPRVDPEVCRQIGLRSAIILPITGASGILGLLEVFSDKPRAFTERDIPTLRTLAGQFQVPRGRVVPIDTSAAVRNATPSYTPPPKTSVSPAPSQTPAPHAQTPAPHARPAAGLPSHAAPSPMPPPASRVSPTSREPERYPRPFQPEHHPRPFQVEALRRTLSTAADEQERKPNRKAMLVALIIAGLVLAGSIYWTTYKFSGSTSRRPQAPVATQSSEPAVTLAQPTSESLPGAPRTRRSSPPKHSGTNKPKVESSATALSDAPVSAQTSNDEAQEVVTRSLTPPQTPEQTQAPPPTLALDLPPTDPGPSALASPPPTVPALSRDMRISQVSELKLIRRIAPRYPRSALLTRREGTVVLRLTVDANGRVKNVNVLSGDEDFARAALDAVREWRYQPLLLNGKPVDVSTDTIITFSLTARPNR